MTVPLVILAAFALLLGLIGTPAWPWFQSFLDGTHTTLAFSAFSGLDVMPVMIFSSLLVFCGLGLGWIFYGRRPIASASASDPLGRLQPQLYSVMNHAFFFDAFYGATLIRWNNGCSVLCDWLDQWVWNGAVQTVSYFVVGIAHLDDFFDASIVNSGFDEGCQRVRLGGQILSLLQDGQVQSYMRVIGCALVLLVIFLLWGAKV